MANPFLSTCAYGDGTPTIHSYNPNFQKEVQSYQMLSSSFCFEIIFPHQNSLGLNLKPHAISYSSSGGFKSIGCLLVIDASAFLSSILSPGDIILRINDINLCQTGDKFDFDMATKAITSAKAPRNVRFLRSYGLNYSLSPAEIMLHMTNNGVHNNSSPTSLFNPGNAPTAFPPTLQLESTSSGDSTAVLDVTTNLIPQPSAKFQVLINPTNATQSLQLMYLDPEAPPAIRQLMQGAKVNWNNETKNNAAHSNNSTSQANKTYITGSGTSSTSGSAALASSKEKDYSSLGFTKDATNINGKGIYKEEYQGVTKYVAMLMINMQGNVIKDGKEMQALQSNGLHMTNILGQKRELEGSEENSKKFLKNIFVGRFDVEEAANSALKLAQEEYCRTGKFTPRRMQAASHFSGAINISTQSSSSNVSSSSSFHNPGNQQSTGNTSTANTSGSGGIGMPSSYSHPDAFGRSVLASHVTSSNAMTARNSSSNISAGNSLQQRQLNSVNSSIPGKSYTLPINNNSTSNLQRFDYNRNPPPTGSSQQQLLEQRILQAGTGLRSQMSGYLPGQSLNVAEMKPLGQQSLTQGGGAGNGTKNMFDHQQMMQRMQFPSDHQNVLLSSTDSALLHQQALKVPMSAMQQTQWPASAHVPTMFPLQGNLDSIGLMAMQQQQLQQSRMQSQNVLVQQHPFPTGPFPYAKPIAIPMQGHQVPAQGQEANRAQMFSQNRIIVATPDANGSFQFHSTDGVSSIPHIFNSGVPVSVPGVMVGNANAVASKSPQVSNVDSLKQTGPSGHTPKAVP